MTTLKEHIIQCDERYKNLEHRLNIVEIKIDGIQKDITDNKRSLSGTILTVGGTIVVSLIGLAGIILTKL
jgi:hypothetical protein